MRRANIIIIIFFLLFTLYIQVSMVEFLRTLRVIVVTFWCICINFLALKRAFLLGLSGFLLGAGVFGDSLGSLGNGVFREFTGKQKPDGGLDFPTGDGAPLVVVGKTRGFGSDTLENVVHERVHDGHGLAADTSVRVHLFQDFVDVNSEGFLPALLPLFLVSNTDGLLGFAGLFNGLSRGLGRHD